MSVLACAAFGASSVYWPIAFGDDAFVSMLIPNVVPWRELIRILALHALLELRPSRP